MMNLEWITGNWTWFLAPLSIIGVLLNNKKDKRYFFLWIITNFCWMIVDFRAHKFDARLLLNKHSTQYSSYLHSMAYFREKRLKKIMEAQND